MNSKEIFVFIALLLLVVACGLSDSLTRVIQVQKIETPQILQLPPILTLENHPDGARYLAFSPDGTILAVTTGERKGLALLWQVSDGKLLGTLEEGPGTFGNVEFSPDGNIIMVSSYNTISLWRTDQRKRLKTLSDRDPIIRAMFSPDGSIIASRSNDQILLRQIDQCNDWSTECVITLLQTEKGESGFHGLAFSYAGNILAYGVCLEKIKSGACVKTEIHLHQISDDTLVVSLKNAGLVEDIAFSPDDTLLISIGCAYRALPDQCINSEVQMWQVSDGTLMSPIRTTGGIVSTAFSPDGKILALGMLDNSVQLWGLSKCDENFELCAKAIGILGQEPEPDGVRRDRFIRDVTFSPDGNLLAAAGVNGIVRLWDMSMIKRGELE